MASPNSDRSIPITPQIPHIRRYFIVNLPAVPPLPGELCALIQELSLTTNGRPPRTSHEYLNFDFCGKIKNAEYLASDRCSFAARSMG